MTANQLTARFLMRLTCNGTVNPVPLTRTHYSQLGTVFYPQLSAVFADVIAAWYGNETHNYSGGYLAGYMAARFAMAPGNSGGAHHLATMAHLENWLHQSGSMQAHKQAVDYLTAYMRHGAQAESFDGARTLALIASLM